MEKEKHTMTTDAAFIVRKTGRTFSDIRESIPMTELLKLYPVLHEASEEKCADTMDRLTERRSGIARLIVT